MAEKKTTSKKAAPKENVVIEENAGTPEVSSEEILNTHSTPDIGGDEELDAPELETDIAPRTNVGEKPKAVIVEGSGEEVFEEDELDAVKAEDREEPTEGELAEQPENNPLKEVEETVEKFDEVTKTLEEKMAEIEKLEPQIVESAAKETLNEIREMEEELRKEIEAEEAALTPKQRKGMRRWLGDFWNGVSSGWDN